MIEWKLRCKWALTVSLCVCVKFFVAGAFAAMETTSNPWSVAKPETFQSLSLTTGLDYRLFTSPSALFLFGEAALWGTQITANTRNAFPPGGFWRLRGRERKQEGGREACVRNRSCPGLFLLQRDADDIHTQTDWVRNVHAGVLSDTPMTDRAQADRGRRSARKQINQPFSH